MLPAVPLQDPTPDHVTHLRDSTSVPTFLDRAAKEEVFLLSPHLERVFVGIGERLARAGDAIETVYFLESGIAGLLEVHAGVKPLTVGLVGREGCLGWPLLLGNDRWRYDVVWTGEEGVALAVRSREFLRIAPLLPGIRSMMFRFADVFAAQLSGTITSNLDAVECRTARWLLLYLDRLAHDRLAITHRELGLMLGVRRASITDALHALESDQAIRAERGLITVRDRRVLERLAGASYGFAEAEYRRLLPVSDSPQG